jgi:hypothetical protein
VLLEADGYVSEDVLTFLEGIGGNLFGWHENVAREFFREVKLKLAYIL